MGPMGSGKTTLGKALAQKLKVDFIDVDDEIVKKAGKSIPEIFDKSGESGFRDIETLVLKEILTAHAKFCVISGGGGIIMRPENRSLIVENTTCLYLYCSVAVQFQRAGGDSNRPVIAKVADQKCRLAEVFSIRDPLFRDICHITVDTGSHSLESCLDYVISSLY